MHRCRYRLALLPSWKSWELCLDWCSLASSGSWDEKSTLSTLRHTAHLLGTLWEVIYCEADCLCPRLWCCDNKNYKFIFICKLLARHISFIWEEPAHSVEGEPPHFSLLGLVVLPCLDVICPPKPFCHSHSQERKGNTTKGWWLGIRTGSDPSASHRENWLDSGKINFSYYQLNKSRIMRNKPKS